MHQINFLLDLLKSALRWFLVAILTVTLFFPVLITMICIYPFDPARKGIHPIVSLWARLILILCPVMNVCVQGEGHLNQKETYVLISNHQSIADIIAALHLKQAFKFIAKNELFWIPFFGWAMTCAGYIPLIRGNSHSAKKAVAATKKHIQNDISVLFFPEGTRSVDGEIHSFKMGAFKLAAETNVPIVPLVIDGTFNLVPKGSRFLSRNADVQLKILPPRRLDGKDGVPLDQLAEGIRSEMIQTLKEIRSKKEIELTSVLEF